MKANELSQNNFPPNRRDYRDEVESINGTWVLSLKITSLQIGGITKKYRWSLFKTGSCKYGVSK